MPLIPYICGICKKRASKMYKFRADAPVTLPCECGETMKRSLGTPSLASVQVVDNGIQAKAVEVNLEVVESNKENAKKDFREK